MTEWQKLAEPLLEALHDADVPLPKPKDPVPIDRLPLSNILDAEAKAAAKRAYSKALIEQELSSALENTSLLADQSKKLPASTAASATKAKPTAPQVVRAGPPKRLAFWELLRAIEKKDLQTILEVRQSQFELLLRKEGGITPLLHCLRLGKDFSTVATVLTGAFSKWVNNLDETQPTKETLRLAIAVRANLKLAINASIASNETDLLSSYLSVIVASSGDKWLRETTHNVAIALRAGPTGKPVHTASAAIRSFATSELRTLTVPGSTNLVASVEDYLANATSDLILYACWTLLPGEEDLPLWYFARDDRVYRAFVERVAAAEKHADYRKLPRLLKNQVETLIKTLEPRAVGYREKAQALEKALDS